MQSNRANYQLIILILLFLFLFLVKPNHAYSKPKSRIRKHKPCMHLVLYYHDILFNGTNKANATSAEISKVTPFGNFNFSNFIVFDDPITENSHLLSPQVARAQGFYIYDTRTNYSAFFAATLVFDSRKYKGTIILIGADIMLEKTRDISVVGGTGDFFMAKGIATLSTDGVEGWKYFRLRMDIKLYECY